jgi:hypothetical protein
MSVVTSFTAVPNRITIIWELLLKSGASGIPSEELSSLVRPVSLQKRQRDESESGSDRMFSEVIAEMQNLGIIAKSREAILNLTTEARGKEAVSLKGYLEQSLLDPQLALNRNQGAVAEAMAWFLTRNPYEPLPWKANFTEYVKEDCGEDARAFDLTDQARSQQFVYWAVYLGLAWRLLVKDQEFVIPDPTSILSRTLPEIISPGGTLPIGDLLEKVAKKLPIFEGGSVRDKVESLMPVNRKRPQRQLSRSTSLGLIRLELIEELKLERIHDSPAINLDTGSGLRPVSQVTWQGEKKK